MTPPRTRQASAWIYQGIWAVLTDLFHVPDQPPVLPTASGTQVVSLRPCAGCPLLRICRFLQPRSVVRASGAGRSATLRCMRRTTTPDGEDR